MTSTFFEGQAAGNEKAARGYSRDSRPDCKQVCIGLVVTRCGLPLGYEVFAGNRHDSTTLQEIVETMERRYGKAQRIWVMDRGIPTEEVLAEMRASDPPVQYLVGTPKPSLLPCGALSLMSARHRVKIQSRLSKKRKLQHRNFSRRYEISSTNSVSNLVAISTPRLWTTQRCGNPFLTN